MEPALPGACESIVSTCGFWNKDALCGERDTLAALFSQCDLHHRQAKRYLACAGAFSQARLESAKSRLNEAKLRAAAVALCRRCCPGKGDGANESLRLLTAITPRGVLSQMQTIAALECELIPIEDRFGIASGALLGYLRELLLDSQHSIITCADPVTGLTQAIIVPECGAAFCASGECTNPDGQRITHCSRFLSKPFSREEKRRLTNDLRTEEALIDLACDRLAMALATHDELEAVYAGASDFSGMDELAHAVSAEFFS